jgi:flagellar basal body-associated protein FliL
MNNIPLIIFIAIMISLVLFFINMFFINKPPVQTDRASTTRMDDLNIILTNTLGSNWAYTIFLLCILFIFFFYLFLIVSRDSCIQFGDTNNKNVKIFMALSIMFMILFFVNLIMLAVKVLQTQNYMKKYCIDAPDASNPSSPLVAGDILKIIGLVVFLLVLLGITFFLIQKMYKPKPPTTVSNTAKPSPPLESYNIPPPLESYNIPPPVESYNIPPPVESYNIPPPVESYNIPPPVESYNIPPPVESYNIPPPYY